MCVCLDGMKKSEGSWSRAGQRGVFDYQADLHGQFSPFMGAEGFLDAFHRQNQTPVLVPVCPAVILIEGPGSDWHERTGWPL